MAQQPMWTAPSVCAPVHACETVPGSKSLTNRTLILAALAAAQGQGTSTISGALRSRDTDLMIGAVRTLGLTVDGDADDLTVSGALSPPPAREWTAGWPAPCCGSFHRWRR